MMSKDYSQMPLENTYDLMQWGQTGRRHHPRYYRRLANTLACSCFGGCLVKSILTQEPIVWWWDSWRFGEEMASGCVAFHVDFEQYGIELPVMPENWVHYIGIDLENPQAAVERIQAEPSLLMQISQSG